MARKNLVRWMAKNDREAYGFWKNMLRPALGRSIRKTDEAIRLLKTCARSPDYAYKTKHRAVARISRQMQQYQNYLGASITFGFLYLLSKDHKRKILRWRNKGLSQQ